MPYTTVGKNLMLDALRGTNPTVPITHASLLTKQANKAVTGTASSDTFTSTAHGYSNADLVFLSGMTGGAGLVANYPYYVIASAANTFQLSEVPGGSAKDFTSDLSAGTVNRAVEITGGAPTYARKVIAFAASAAGVIDDTTNGAVFDIPAGGQVDYSGYNSALTVGSLLAITAVVTEVFASQGTYTLTDAKLDLNS